MSTLHVAGGHVEITSDEGLRLEELLGQESRARERLSRQLLELTRDLRKELDFLKGQLAQGKPLDSAEQPSETSTATTAPPKSNACVIPGGDSGLRDVLSRSAETTSYVASKTISVRDAAAVRPARLDAGGMYEAEQSVWDAAAFIGHDSIGPGVSIILALLWALNIAMQIAFCVLVFLYMQDADITTDTLDELLTWRVTVAHHVDYADTVVQRSMIADMCGENAQAQLHMSATQASWHETIQNFNQGGEILMYLAQTLWICTVFRELTAAWNFGSALFFFESRA